ncbi:putative TetR family transcriptional regulator [Gordonia araii NBRC 100433]|uniref:Putative TetR family transcriptional regulator n=1 Tax=Gordonia araii NBRC 100433 TaxID=1073574 RepID=G7H3T8_9ACTN|nr:TetR/AcrR family transcriptional regulator [Gordonia araii]NNG98666.1 TetR family transcriptional regulator [Gordonia araii NBRC 100433]GAB10513.1 putative TetR family transcriptional regulator [Gordonia araii NBRC 100433]
MPPSASLDRTTIIDAALAILEHEGADKLTMRRLADELGSKPMTLYHYVPNKEALLSMALSEVAARIDWAVPTGPPRERMIEIAIDMRDRLAAIPWIVAILQEGANVGTPALAIAERFFEAAYELGADDQTVLDLWRVVWSLTVSDVHWAELARQRAAGQHGWFDTIDPAAVADLPRVSAMLPKWRQVVDNFDLRRAIAAQIDGMLGSSG